MLTRRDFLAASSAAAAGLALPPLAYSQEPKKEGRKKLAVTKYAGFARYDNAAMMALGTWLGL